MGGGDRAVFCCCAAITIIEHLHSLCIAAVHILGK